MKKAFTRLGTVLLLGLPLLLPHLASAQPSQPGNSNGTLLCPGKTYIFSSTSSPNTSNCAVNWAVTGGSTLLANPTTAGIMNVSFNDVPGGVATLQTTYTNCNNATANGQSPMLTVYIRSITNRPLGTLTLNGSTSGNIEFGSTAPVTLEVAALAIPRNSGEPNPVTILAAGYEWTIPSGWAWPDGAISNGTPRLFRSPSVSNPTRIVVTPPATACSGGAAPVVRVRAVDTECSVGAVAGYTPTKSAEKSLTVNCITPPLTIVSNRTQQGGPISLFCGQRLEDEQVQPGFGVIPGNGGFSNFTFTTGGIVGSTGSLNTRTPVLSVSGPGTGTIGLSATYTRNGVSAAVAAVPVTVTVRPEVAPVGISIGSSGTLYCGSAGLRLSAFTTAGTAGTYRWSASNGATVTPTTTSNATTPVMVTGGWDGDITVTVTASNPAFGCASSSAAVTVYHNRGVISESLNPLTLTVTGPNGTFVAPNGSTICGRPTQLEVNGFDLYGNPLPGNLRWIVNGQEYSSGTALGVALRQSQVTIVLTNACGYDDYYYWTVPVEGTCSGGGGGTGPLDPPPYDPGFAAYPNPATDEVSVTQAGGEVRLYNAHGKPVRNQKTAPGRVRLDLRGLPAGLYYLEARNAKGTPVRQQVRIER